MVSSEAMEPALKACFVIKRLQMKVSSVPMIRQLTPLAKARAWPSTSLKPGAAMAAISFAPHAPVRTA